MNRRTFFKTSVRSLGSACLANTLSQLYSSPIFAQQASDYRAIVCLFLDGGLDCNNAVIPMDAEYNDYAAVRPDLKFTQSALCALKPTSAKRSFGLHPALSQTANLFNAGEAAVLANVGTIACPTSKADLNYANEMPNNLYSHSSQIGCWETALAKSVSSTGWAGRVADALLGSGGSGKMPAVVSVSGSSLFEQGEKTSGLTAAIGNGGAADLINTLANLQQYFLASESGPAYNDLVKYLSAQQTLSINSNKILLDTYNAGSFQTTFPGYSVAEQLRIVAKLIAGHSAHDTRRQIFVVRDGPYDTHQGQAGPLSDRLTQLDPSIGAFVAALKEMGMYNNVTLFTASDFGRSLVQNISNGTDHAWGGHHFVIGGAVKGGDMYGTFPTLTPGGPDDANSIGIWIPTTATTQYAATMANWLGVPTSQLASIFPELPNFSTKTLSFI